MSDAKNTLREFLRSNSLHSSLGNLKVQREIGEGGNGLVYEGILYELPVAIKFLINPDKHKLTRFKAEYLNVVMLPSNRFVAKPLLYEEFVIGSETFSAILLKKYDGHLRRQDTPSTEGLRSLVKFLLDSLNFIHSHGIVHRDLKPENVLLEGDTYVLADFGIASYNPEMFRLMADTRRGERLGNRKFSAPEQEEGSIEAHPTMDIYALGQIIQWYVTGSIHRGTRRTQISSVIPNSDVYDFLLDKCLANTPSQRFQSVTEIKNAANNFIESQQSEQRRPKFTDPFDNYLNPFADAVRVVSPKVSGGVVYTEDKKRIDRFVAKLSEHDFDSKLWWTDGMRDMYFKFTRIDDETLLMGDGNNGDEVRIKSMWMYYSPSVYGDVVLLTMDAMPSFGVYEERRIDWDEYKELRLTPSEEAVLIDDKYYITRAEFDNGYAEIDNEVIDLGGYKKKAVRTRYLESYSIFVGTTFHNVLQRESERDVLAFIERHDKGVGITNQIFQAFAESIRKNLDENVRYFR